MKQQFTNSSSAKSSNFGGIKAAAKIMNFTEVGLESKIMEGVTEKDEELALKIQDNMFTFENLSALDNRSIQTLMRSIENDMLMTALKAADAELSRTSSWITYRKRCGSHVPRRDGSRRGRSALPMSRMPRKTLCA